jgi:hypothetical protein
MPKWFAEKVYDAKYWDALNCDLLPAGLDYAVCDYGVNSGIGRAGKVLRRLLDMGPIQQRKRLRTKSGIWDANEPAVSLCEISAGVCAGVFAGVFRDFRPL